MSQSTGTTRSQHVTVVPTGKALGAEIQGVDLRIMNDDDFADIKQAWLDHLVLLFRRQNLTDDHLIAFSQGVVHNLTSENKFLGRIQ